MFNWQAFWREIKDMLLILIGIAGVILMMWGLSHIPEVTLAVLVLIFLFGPAIAAGFTIRR